MAEFSSAIKSRGASLVEVMVAIALFSLYSTALIGLLINSYQTNVQAEQKDIASWYAQEGLDAVFSIRRQGWNFLQNGTYGLDKANGYWEFLDTSDTFDNKYTRTVTILDACRDIAGDIVDCTQSGATVDVHTKKVNININFTAVTQIDNNVDLEAYLTTWQTLDWTQTDWSNPSSYEFDDGNLEVSISGQVTLAQQVSGACGEVTWNFDTPANYTYDSSEVEMTAGVAQLLQVAPGITQISDAVISTAEFDTNFAADPEIIHVSGDVYAVIYKDHNNNGAIATMTIDSSGAVSANIDTEIFEATVAHEPDIIHVSGDIYLIAYRGQDEDGFVKTITIDSSGNIGLVVDSLEFDTVEGRIPRLIHVAGDIYAVAYHSIGSDGFIRTFSVDSSGDISNSIIDSLEFDPVSGIAPNIIHVSGDVYAVVYRSQGTDGWVVTLSINSSGDISDTIIDGFEFESAIARDSKIVHVSGDVYAISYRGPLASHGSISTVEIDPTGDITNSVIDTFTYETASVLSPDILQVSSSIYLLTYRGSGGDGFSLITEIDSAGEITDSVLDTIEFDTSYAATPEVINTSGDIYAIAYQGVGLDGFIKTIEVTEKGIYSTNKPTINPVNEFSVDSVDAWTSFTEVASKDDGEIYYQISDDEGGTWYYWNGSAWVIAGLPNFNTAEVINDNIWQFSAVNKAITFRAFLESDSLNKVQLDQVSIGCASLQMEVGQVLADENWVTVDLQNIYQSPVVVGSYHEASNTLPASVRIRNVDSDSFEVRLQNPSDADLSTDTITYFVIEEGKWNIFGMDLEAHLYETNKVGSSFDWTNFDIFNFDRNFSSSPVVMHQVMSDNDPSWITTYVARILRKSDPPQTDGIRIGLMGGEATASHGEETIGWIAIDNGGFGILDNIEAQTKITFDANVGHDDGICFNTSYANPTTTVPLTLAFQQEMDGGDGGWIVSCNNTLNEIGLHVEEDQVGDPERTHTSERAGYIAFNDAFNYSTFTEGGGIGSGSAYATNGSLISSAFDTGANSSFNIISWDEVIPSCSPNCEIRTQIRTAPDISGSPGTWTDWYGQNGASTYFTDSVGEIISTDLNFNQWVQYRVELIGDGDDTPILEEIIINYLP